MYEILENNRSIGLVFRGYHGRLEALATIRELVALTIGGGDTSYSVVQLR